MKKILNFLICFTILLSFSLNFNACEKTCEHNWELKESTQEKTVYECSKCILTKEYALVFDKVYTYTTTKIIIPETLSLEELKQTLPINVVSITWKIRETLERIGEIDTVEKFKTVLNCYIETGELRFSQTTDNGAAIIYVAKPFNSITVINGEENYTLKLVVGDEEDIGEIPKVENTPILMEDVCQELRFMDGKIQYEITYLKDIKIIFNFEIL